MNLPLLLCLVLLGAAVVMLRRSLHEQRSEQVMQQVVHGRSAPQRVALGRLQRELLRSGVDLPLGVWALIGTLWLLAVLLVIALGGWVALLLVTLLPLVLLRLYMSLQYKRRVQRMVSQMPQFLDSVVRSLKSGRTLGDGMLLAMDTCPEPLRGSLTRTRNSIQRGLPLAEAMADFADLYEREEFQILALGVAVNQRYGGNASELLDNLITMIRDWERAARKLRAMTGETRISAVVLGGMPVAIGGYIMLSNPQMLMNMWEQSGGKMVLLLALGFQVVGVYLLWRMLRSL